MDLPMSQTTFLILYSLFFILYSFFGLIYHDCTVHLGPSDGGMQRMVLSHPIYSHPLSRDQPTMDLPSMCGFAFPCTY